MKQITDSNQELLNELLVIEGECIKRQRFPQVSIKRQKQILCELFIRLGENPTDEMINEILGT